MYKDQFTPEYADALAKRIKIPLADIKGDLERITLEYDHLILLFSDGRWAIFKNNYMGDGESVIEYIRGAYDHEFESYALYHAKIINSKVYEAQRKLDEINDKNREEEADRARYEILKQKFEGEHGK